MKSRLLSLLMVPLLGVALGACTAEQTEEGDLPDVDVEGGNVPEYDVDAADVDVETDTATVEVPTDIDVEPDTGGV
ncbi:MAG: hypothetical protein ACRELV_03465 [Longimicrobiales bacterium]